MFKKVKLDISLKMIFLGRDYEIFILRFDLYSQWGLFQPSHHTGISYNTDYTGSSGRRLLCGSGFGRNARSSTGPSKYDPAVITN